MRNEVTVTELAPVAAMVPSAIGNWRKRGLIAVDAPGRKGVETTFDRHNALIVAFAGHLSAVGYPASDALSIAMMWAMVATEPDSFSDQPDLTAKYAICDPLRGEIFGIEDLGELAHRDLFTFAVIDRAEIIRRIGILFDE